MTQNIDRLDFRIRTTFDLQGTFEPDSGQIRILGAQTRQFAIDEAGALSASDMDALRQELAGTTASDVDEMVDRVAEDADAAPELPEAYRTQGRFTEATPDVAIGEGFKGERVRGIQEQLRTDGYDLGEGGVDGLWGPDTQTAYDAYVADGRPALDLGGPAAEEAEEAEEVDAADASEAEEAPSVDAGAEARRFARASDRSGDFDPEGAAETLLGLDNASMSEVRSELGRSGRSMDDRIAAMEGDFLGQFAIAGRDAHYIDFMQRVAAGERNEGDAAEATPERVDAYERRLVNALESRDTGALNAVFAEASDAQIAALDQRFANDGVWNRDGSVLQYEEGLADYVRAMTHGTLDGGGAHESALLFRLQQARGGES